MWEQETNPVVITPRKVRNGLRTFNDRNYLVRWIDRSMFFGYSLLKYGEYFIPVAEPEKIFIDMIYYHEFLPDEAKVELINTMRPDVFLEFYSRLTPFLRKRVVSAIKNEQHISEDFRRKFVN